VGVVEGSAVYDRGRRGVRAGAGSGAALCAGGGRGRVGGSGRPPDLAGGEWRRAGRRQSSWDGRAEERGEQSRKKARVVFKSRSTIPCPLAL
jgi:hypothetical protein